MSEPVSRAPMAMTLASLCSRASLAESGSETSAQRHGGVAVDRDGNADARAAQRHAAFGFAFGDMRGELVAIVGVIDRSLAVGAKIGDLVALRGQPCGKLGLEGEGGVIGGDGDAHGGSAIRCG